MVPVEHSVGEVVRLQRLDGGLRREARTGERGENAASGYGLRLARRISDARYIVRVRGAWEAERNAACNVQDWLGAFRIRAYFGPSQHLFQVCVRIPFADAQPYSSRVSARDDPSEEARCDFVSDEQRHESGISSDAGHLHLKARKDLPRSEDVEPLRHVRADAVASDEEFGVQFPGLPVLVNRNLDAAVLLARGLSLRPQERVGPFPNGIGRNRPVEHRPLHNDRLRAVAIDDEPSTRGRVELGAMDRADDRLFAVHVFEAARRDEATALDRLPDLAVLLDEGDLISGLRNFAREVAAGGACADHDDVKGACGCDHVPASLLQIYDDLEEVLQVSRQGGIVRVAARGQVRRRDQGRGAVHDHVRRDQAFAVHDARPFRDFLTGLRDDSESDAAGDRLLDLLPDVLPDLREGWRGHDARLRRLVDQLADLLEDARLRDDRVDKLRLPFRPQDLVEQVELRERVLQVVDHASLDLARRLGLEDRRAPASGNRESFLTQALKDLVRRRPRDLRGLGNGLRAPVAVRDERDVSAGLVSGEADRLEGLRGPLEFLVEVDAARQQLRQILRNHGAPILTAGFYLFEWRRRCWIAKRRASLYPTGAFLRVYGFGAPSRPRCGSLPSGVLECLRPRGRPESRRPHGRHDGLRTVRNLRPEWRRPRDVDAHGSQGGGPPRENSAPVRRIRSDPARLSLRRRSDLRERRRRLGSGRGRKLHGPGRERPRGVRRTRNARAVHAAGALRPPR